MYSLTFISVRKRLIYCFGLPQAARTNPANEAIMRMDTHNLENGWELLSLPLEIPARC
jgi:hypothetical protein